MILAAAACGEDPDLPPPAELRLAFQATTYGALPLAGGLFDQPAGLLSRMTQAYNTWLAYHSFHNCDLAHYDKWAKANPDLNRILQRVRKLREAHASL
jgi:hypothetical protein